MQRKEWSEEQRREGGEGRNREDEEREGAKERRGEGRRGEEQWRRESTQTPHLLFSVSLDHSRLAGPRSARWGSPGLSIEHILQA